MSFYDNLVCRSFRNFNFSNKTFFFTKMQKKTMQCWLCSCAMSKTDKVLPIPFRKHLLFKKSDICFFFFQTLLPKMLRNIDERLRRPSQSFYMKELFLALGLKFPFWKILWPKKLLNMYVICRMLKKVCVDKRSLSH